MAKSKQDIIIRDRMQFTLDTNGDQTTVYGRISLDDWVNPTEGSGMSIKQIFLMPRLGAGSLGLNNTGVWHGQTIYPTDADNSTTNSGAMKIFVTTRAYENAVDVGIASPDVLHLETWLSVVNQNAASGVNGGRGLSVETIHTSYGPQDLHPGGFTVVSDLLVGVAVDNIDQLDDEVIDVDVLIIADPVKVTKNDLLELMSQAQDV